MQGGFNQYLFDDFVILDKSDNSHPAVALGTRQWVHFIYLLNQPGPVFQVFTGRPVRLKDGGYLVVLIVLFTFAATHVTVVPIIPDSRGGTPLCWEHGSTWPPAIPGHQRLFLDELGWAVKQTLAK